jgi:hypothetical protein
LLHRGSSTYRSSLGGFLTLLAKAFILCYFGYQLKAVVQRENLVVNQSTVRRDLSDHRESPAIRLDKENFRIAIRFEVETDEGWFKPEEIDRYIQVQYR